MTALVVNSPAGASEYRGTVELVVNKRVLRFGMVEELKNTANLAPFFVLS
jgi:hypothetical protein